MRRRRFLKEALIVSIVGLAGCTGGDQNGGATDGADQTEGTPEPTQTRTPTPSPRATPTASPTPSATTDDTATPTPTQTASPKPTPTPTRTPSPSPTATPEPTPTVAKTVEVGPDGRFRFDPETFEIGVGETVRWVWRSGGHNVKPSSVPSGASWEGTPGEEFDTFNSGHTYSYTFETAGTYKYYCAPHRSSGMTGSFTVE